MRKQKEKKSEEPLKRKITFIILSLFTINCTNFVKLPEDFKIEIYVWTNLMPSPIQYPRKIKGYIEIKGSFEEEPELKRVSLLYNKKEFKVPFKKEKDKWLIEISPDIISQMEQKEYLKLKLLLSYKSKIFEIIKEKIEIKRIY